ncbi:MAG TPA: hypothetical protein VKW06_18915 [Candidatus Angelobacter sp.]|nr:hypothetical protein [Candidatus Angelobacter sp.]
MARWITFDENTALELRSRIQSGSVFEAPGRNALEYALASSGNVVAVLSARVKNHCALAAFLRAPAEPALPYRPRAIRATGFLGLGDEAIYEEEEPQRPKSWWRRIWED